MALSDSDLHFFNEGTHSRLYERLGAHPEVRDGVSGTRFAVWAPNARRVGVIGSFGDWRDPAWLEPMGRSGLWQGFLPGIAAGALYKYRVESRVSAHVVDKADPFAFHCETPPGTASIVWQGGHDWRDEAWMSERRRRNALDAPMSIYEVHVGSWRRQAGDDWPNYRALAAPLVEHVRATGFTHVEFMPVMEHPFYGSWGYQVTGYFAPTSRYGRPEDFMYLVDELHRHGIGVILDWVPAHFPADEHGLVYFDGTHLYEHGDPRQGRHAEWGSAVYDYGRPEVRSFLLSSAMFWLDRFHVDGLRVDAVASMLYLDYGRKQGEWIPNRYGGNENTDAIDFLRRCNEAVYQRFPDVQMIAEESTAWPQVSRPVYTGGLGFGLKWDMGWMHDTLAYLAHDPIHRKHHHGTLTFRAVYQFNENFVLPLSHDEVVHGKGSLLGKMPGDDWRKFANLRLLYTYMWTAPGKKLLFMGGEFGQRAEWNHDRGLEWDLLAGDPRHGRLQLLVGELNRLYRDWPALHEADCDAAGFAWVDASDADNSVISFERRSRDGQQVMLVVLNLTPVPRFNYRVGVDREGHFRELLNSDAESFGGSGHGNAGGVEVAPVSWHGRRFSLNLTLPPLAGVVLTPA